LHFGDSRQTDTQTNRQTDEQMDNTDALSRSRCREQRLNNFSFLGSLFLNTTVKESLLKLVRIYRSYGQTASLRCIDATSSRQESKFTTLSISRLVLGQNTIITARRVCIALTMPWQDVCPSVRPSVRPFVCPFVCPSVIRRYSM